MLGLSGMDRVDSNIVQSQMMDHPLKAYGKSSVLIKLPNEDHWLSRADTRVRVLKELEKFLAANLRPQ